VGVFDPVLKFRSHLCRVYLIHKVRASAQDGTNVPSGR
jgi:hypothetical protein